MQHIFGQEDGAFCCPPADEAHEVLVLTPVSLFLFLPRLWTLDTQGKDFVMACNKLVADLAADSSRAEAEAMLIAAATPIMPVVSRTGSREPLP